MSPIGPPDDELDQLRRRLQRERARREAAEQIGERATSDLYATVNELRTAQAELSEHSDRQRVVAEVARRLGRAHDVDALMRLGAAATTDVLGLSRCAVHLSEPAAGLPEPLLDLVDPHVWPGEPVAVTDVVADPRLADAATEVAAAIGGRAIAVTAVGVATLRLGWLVLVCEQPHSWTDRELAVADGIGQELGAGILRAQAAEQQESVRRLEELDRAKDALISNVSHELRTPLTSIQGYVELLEAGDLGPLATPTASAVRVIGRNTERLGRLVENLLRLSAQDEHAVLDLGEVDLGALAHEARAALRSTIEERRLEVTVTAPPDGAMVLADREQLEEVVHNLLSNAVKFTEPGGRATVTVEPTHDGVVLVVADTGIGIPASELGSVFSRFFRSSLSVSREIQGTGLGLALSRSIVEHHGGRISVESVEAAGTTVRVELPADGVVA